LRPILDHRAQFAANESEIAVAQWVFDHGEIAGRGTETLPAAQALYLPMASPNKTLGVLAVRGEEFEQLLLPEARSLLEAFAAQVALAMERDQLTLESQTARVEAEAEQLRSTLLSSVSHDIRTPLAVIAGASSSLLEQNGKPLDDATRRELLGTIAEESSGLSRLVENLLRLTQLSAGKFQIDKEWHPVEDVIGSALHRVKRSLGERPLEIDLPDEMLMGQFDAVLIEQVLVNLLENAARYTPAGTPISISGRRLARGVALEVADRGPGLDPAETEALFNAFSRGRGAGRDSRGVGLGLAICRAIVEAHGGKISAGNRADGGAIFRCELPSQGTPPAAVMPAERQEAAE
jgi:two-component system sensor histidine kinase KdpD